MPGQSPVAVCLAIAAVACPLQAQETAFECAPLRPSTSKSPPYERVSGQPRCEGFFDQNVSRPFLELLSLTRGPGLTSSADAGQGVELYADSTIALRLIVQPMSSVPFYRVDAAMRGRQPLAWDPAPMIERTQLAPANIAFLALPNGPQAGVTTVVPVSLSEQARSATRVFAVVRVSVDVESISWRSYPTGGTASEWQDVPNSQLYAWHRITLPIDLPADSKSTTVDVQANATEGKRTLPLLRFTILGPADVPPGR